MRAIHWLRSRQESRKLAYWLSLVAYDRGDRSLSNRIYLLYLALFFGAWVFITLTFFAGNGALLLRSLSPEDPVRAAVFLEALAIGAWNIYNCWQATRRSPVVFSEQDETLICQTPVNRRCLALRWLLMPWLESAFPFWLLAVVLGFSVAETVLAGGLGVQSLPVYTGYGLCAWLVLLPLHLGLYALQWAVGVLRLQRDEERGWLAWVAVPAAAAFTCLALARWIGDPRIGAPWSGALLSGVNPLLYPIWTGFTGSGWVAGVLAGGFFAAAALGALWGAAGNFNLSRAAQETRLLEQIRSAEQYGFTAYAQALRSQQRLRTQPRLRTAVSIPAASGAAALVWKDILQSQRGFRLSALYPWCLMFLLMLGLPLLPDFISRSLVLAVWAIQVGQAGAVRVRGDLACWVLVRQLPISSKAFLFYELTAACLLALGVSLAGLCAGALIGQAPIGMLALSLPGIILGVAAIAAYDVLRRARIQRLLAGSSPEVSAAGIFLVLAAAAAPWLVGALLPGAIGLALAALVSLSVGAGAFLLAVRAYRKLGEA